MSAARLEEPCSLCGGTWQNGAIDQLSHVSQLLATSCTAFSLLTPLPRRGAAIATAPLHNPRTCLIHGIHTVQLALALYGIHSPTRPSFLGRIPGNSCSAIAALIDRF